MRPIGLVAAAAAGLIAPLAIAMPALAGTESPVLSGMSGIVDGNNGPDNGDNGDNNGDDNGDNKGDNNGDYDNNGDNGDDNGDYNNNGDDNGDNGDDNGGPYLSAYSAGSESTGDTSFIVDVNDASAFDTYVLESPGLNAACDSNSISGATEEADRFGHLNVSGDADNCIPGEYTISVSQTGGHEETYDVKVHVD